VVVETSPNNFQAWLNHGRVLSDRFHIMRTNIVIDDRLMKAAMRAYGTKTKRETVERSLKLLVALKRQERIRRFRGKLRWEGDLDVMRRDRFADR
jgi:Arc/MetJ family transcription regulator